MNKFTYIEELIAGATKTNGLTTSTYRKNILNREDIKSSYSGSTQYNLIFAHMLGFSSANRSMKLHKNGSELFSPETPSSRDTSHFAKYDPYGATTWFSMDNTPSTTSNRYELYGGFISSGSASSTYALNSPTTSTISDANQIGHSTFGCFGLTVGDGGLAQAPQTTTKTDTGTNSTSASTWWDTGISATITPTSASKKLLVMGNILVSKANVNPVRMKLQRDGFDIVVGTTAGSRSSCTYESMSHSIYLVSIPIFVLLDAGSTSETTIDVHLSTYNSSAENIHINRTDNDTDSTHMKRGVSQLTILEI